MFSIITSALITVQICCLQTHAGPGETRTLPLEVALMQMASKPPCCENSLELLERFEMVNCYILVLENPHPCLDICMFYLRQNGLLCEPLDHVIMLLVVHAGQHCRGREVGKSFYIAGQYIRGTDQIKELKEHQWSLHPVTKVYPRWYHSSNKGTV